MKGRSQRVRARRPRISHRGDARHRRAYRGIARAIARPASGSCKFYDLDSAAPAQLANIATRGLVQTGDDVMIGGFIIGGNYPAKVLIRAIGPSLPVDGRLEDPALELVDSNGSTISNDDWPTSQEAEVMATTIPPANERESAIVATLVPGAYTAVVRGKHSTTGIALVEGYNLQ